MRRAPLIALLLLPAIAQARLQSALPFPPPDPCAGPSGLLAELDRPTVGDSACVVKPGHAIVELGYASAHSNQGTVENGPQAELRFGLPRHNEFVLLPPNATHMENSRIGGTSYSATTMGLKHEWGYTRHWIYTGEILFTTPSTGNIPGNSDGWGEAVNGIVGYSVTSRIAVGLMLGATSLYDQNGRRYTSINPDFTATWPFDPRWQLYGEIYGQTHTSYGAGSGWDSDGGVQYLLTRHIEVDAEVGQRLTGALGGYRNYWGFGAGWEF
ncbi:MAG: transporter [Acidiferrobacter sp.]